jgi:inosine-uridine nucleoside N-ribohydrolase
VSAQVPVFLDVDTGTDDAGALLYAATSPAMDLVGASATWGNCGRDQAVRNTLVILEAAGCSAPVYPGAEGPVGPTPTHSDAELVMGGDGLGDCGVEDPVGQPNDEPGAEALVRTARQYEGRLVLVAVAPLSTVACALKLDPDLPGRLADVIVMGGAIDVSGNITAAAEANIGHDPEAAVGVIDAFGAPGALAGGRPPKLVPLDVTLRGPLTGEELDALGRSPLAGAALLHRIWSAIWPTGLLETGRDGVWPAHDLLAIWTLLDPDVCRWMTVPLAVDTGGSAAWGATVADRRLARYEQFGVLPERLTRHIPDTRWDVALGVDGDRYRAGVREWLGGQG